tara:strand:- start:18 stop:236 length:219 start_codon:yes stop_codon:yes gene_type:complete
MTMQFQITDISFDCSLDDSDWTLNDQRVTEERLPQDYIGSVWEADCEEDLIEEISCDSGWCINSIDYQHILK